MTALSIGPRLISVFLWVLRPRIIRNYGGNAAFPTRGVGLQNEILAAAGWGLSKEFRCPPLHFLYFPGFLSELLQDCCLQRFNKIFFLDFYHE
jgi:hypothetical protein